MIELSITEQGGRHMVSQRDVRFEGEQGKRQDGPWQPHASFKGKAGLPTHGEALAAFIAHIAAGVNFRNNREAKRPCKECGAPCTGLGSAELGDGRLVEVDLCTLHQQPEIFKKRMSLDKVFVQ